MESTIDISKCFVMTITGNEKIQSDLFNYFYHQKKAGVIQARNLEEAMFSVSKFSSSPVDIVVCDEIFKKSASDFPNSLKKILKNEKLPILFIKPIGNEIALLHILEQFCKQNIGPVS